MAILTKFVPMGLVYLRELDQDTRFAIWRIEESAEELIARLQLDEREQAILESLNQGKRRLHWLATRVLLRYMLNTPDFIECQADANGKPYLVNLPQQISLTHSFDYAAVMLGEQKAVGIDLELVSPKIFNIARKFMHESELDFIEVVEDSERRKLTLYACWCAKEAVYKLQGDKGVSFRENMRIAPFHFQEQGMMQVVLSVGDETEALNVYYERFQDYMLAYVRRPLGHGKQKEVRV